jgi:membrane-bound lytic murein transglycosylase B
VPDLLAMPNFRALLSYNNSPFYAAAVAHLADNICERSPLEGSGRNPR